jgi:L-threonylcarbamoyladenylate synthase
MQKNFEQDIVNCLDCLAMGGVILYPTDTVWGLGCDPTNASAVQKIYELKKRDDSKSMIVLAADERDILNYVAAPDLAVFDFLEQQIRPTTIIFEHALNLADNLVAADGSIAIRLARDEFCRHLIRRFRKPVVSTSANISGSPTPEIFAAVSEEIKKGVDYIVNWRQNDAVPAQPSRIIKWNSDGTWLVIRS